MTQEELDALMGTGIDNIDSLEGISESTEEDIAKPNESSETTTSSGKPYGYNEGTSHHWPLPATEEHKMVHQLDDVTKESEEKATEIFDIIENISNELMEKEENINNISEVFSSNIELFSTLSEKFPDVNAFKSQLEKNKTGLDETASVLDILQASGDSIMSVMDIMQYQDIHRQKIERVINVMRALSRYMNALFEGRIDDDKRVASAQHLPGDKNDELASMDDIETLLEKFGD
ncbi:MAG: chemotaxis protein [Sulfurimonas sp.]|nr:MAG: chemotaxis protein [Sulfurimonas sp.]